MKFTPKSKRATDDNERAAKPGAFFWVIIQIIIIDMVFSLDSIITAIGMAQDLEIMIAAVVIACLIMYISSGPVAAFVAEHPTTKMLALAFLVLIGVALVADGFKFPYSARLHLLRHRVFGGGRVLQCAGQTQPQESRSISRSDTLSPSSS